MNEGSPEMALAQRSSGLVEEGEVASSRMRCCPCLQDRSRVGRANLHLSFLFQKILAPVRHEPKGQNRWPGRDLAATCACLVQWYEQESRQRHGYGQCPAAAKNAGRAVGSDRILCGTIATGPAETPIERGVTETHVRTRPCLPGRPISPWEGRNASQCLG